MNSSRKTAMTAAAIAAMIMAPAPAATADPLAQTKPIIGGGTRIITTHGVPEANARHSYLCTLTAVGYDDHHNLVGLTNAHCFYDNFGNQYHGDGVYLEKPGTNGHIDAVRGPVGRVAVIGPGNPIVGGPQGAGLDYAVVVFDTAAVTPTNRIGDVEVTGFAPPPEPGTPLCKYTSVSGTQCGPIIATTGPYFSAAIAGAPGESGAPVLSGTTLVGTLWVATTGTSITAILADLASTRGPGTGFRLL